MRIQPFLNTNYQNKQHLIKNKAMSQPTEVFNNRPSFGYDYDDDAIVTYKYYPNSNFDPLNVNDSELTTLGEVFHKESTYRIEELCKRKYSTGGLFGKYKNSYAYEAYQKLLNRIEKAQNNKAKLIFDLNSLLRKEALGEGNMLEKKIEFKQGFLTMLEEDKKGKNALIDNGILVYGSSEKKDEFIQWISKEADASFKEIDFDEKDPVKSVKNIAIAAQDAQKVYEHTGNRTILYVKNLDKFLTNQEDENLRVIGRFKGFVENAAKNYHTTILMKTDLPLESFEDASIGAQRFRNKIKLTHELSKSDVNKKNDLNNEINRLDKMAKKSVEYYREERNTYSPSGEGHLP